MVSSSLCDSTDALWAQANVVVSQGKEKNKKVILKNYAHFILHNWICIENFTEMNQMLL